MGFLDRAFVGRVVKEFGSISEKSLGVGKQKVSLLLAERGGRLKLVFKTSAWAFLGGGVSYLEIPAEATPKLQQWVDEAQVLLTSEGAHPARTVPGS